MDTHYLQVACNVIILLGGVAAAITGILALCGRPIKFFKKRRDKAERERRAEIVKDVKSLVDSDIMPALNNIKEQNDSQSESIAKLTNTMRNSLGAEIMAFYEAHRQTRTITESEKDAIEDLYKSYKEVKGNHYVDAVYDRMTYWTVVTEEGEVIKDVKWWKPKEEEK